jgi:hypothetical protein
MPNLDARGIVPQNATISCNFSDATRVSPDVDAVSRLQTKVEEGMKIHTKVVTAIAKKLGWMAVLAGVFALAAPTSQAQAPGPHPAYLHALSDLRAARHYLADGWAWEGVRREDNDAIMHIDKAIEEIKHASIDDGKGFNDPFPMDRHLSPHDRFRKANELLAAAHHDLDHAEDVPQARGLRDRAILHIDQAHQIVDHAWQTAHW